MRRDAVLVAVGDELLCGSTVDRNSPWLAAALQENDFTSLRTTVVGDDVQALAEALADGLSRARLVVVTGGLGPTEDDLTRHAAARAVGRELVESQEAWDSIRDWFARRDVEVPKTNRRQALLPEGAEVLPNESGTAPGFTLEQGGSRLFALPGPPVEMRAMFEAQVRPRLMKEPDGAGFALHRLQLFGISESVFAEEVGDWMARDANPLLGCSVKNGVLTASFRARGDDAAGAQRLLDERVTAFRARFDAFIFAQGEERVEQALGAELIARGMSVTLAESCTSGLAAALLGRVPGISAVLGAAWVTYSDDSKQRLLGVRAETLAAHGAVSEPVVSEMALGAAERAGARAAVAISGVAGPAGASAEKPVGTVCFATSIDGEVEAETRRLPPTSRDHIRSTAAQMALILLYRRLTAAG